MTKILIFIPVWKRSTIFSLVLKNIDYFIRKNVDSVRIEVFCVLSKDDPELKNHLANIKQAGWKTVFAPNDPLGEKQNIGIKEAMKKHSFHYLMALGSDDLIHPDLMNLYSESLKNNVPFFGIDKLYFYDWPTREAIYFDAFYNKRCLGAARMISRDLLEQVFEKEGKLFTPNINCGLDGDSSARIITSAGVTETVLNADKFPYLIDIKCNVSITKWARLRRMTEHLNPCPVSFLDAHYPHIKIFNKKYFRK